MVQLKSDTDTNKDEIIKREVRVVFARKMEERRVFMEELKEVRNQRRKRIFGKIRQSIGPRWYQVLSVPQRAALDTLECAIYQDLIEGRPTRVTKIIRALGIYPMPKKIDLMACTYLGRNDPKEMVSQLYMVTYGESFVCNRATYPLTAKLMLSAIFYLGLDDLLGLLKERFRPPPETPPPPPKPRPKPEKPLESPYLQPLVAGLYMPPKPKRFVPRPMPDLEEIDEPYEEPPAPVLKKELPPPPPPPPKKRLPLSYCDAMAGLLKVEKEEIPEQPSSLLRSPYGRKTKISKTKLSTQTLKKKAYGIENTGRKKTRRKPVAPTTSNSNSQYHIIGVYTIHEKSFYILGSLCILPPDGTMIHGGFRYWNGEYIHIHCGYYSQAPPMPNAPCECLKKWSEPVFKYIKDSKCYCGHYYDFGHEPGTFPNDLPPYFRKPTPKDPTFGFNYETVYEIKPQILHVQKEFKKVWETESFLHVEDSTAMVDKKDTKKKKKKKSSTTCLGDNPAPEDYLKCSLWHMRGINLAAQLPDVHLTPELLEWMRRRLFGPLSRYQKAELLARSFTRWMVLRGMEVKGFGHVAPTYNPDFSGCSTWEHKHKLSQLFHKFVGCYKRSVFVSHSNLNNLLWATMFQAEFPDKKFREIYFSYMTARVTDLHLLHPYINREAQERHILASKRKYICLPKGVDDLD